MDTSRLDTQIDPIIADQETASVQEMNLSTEQRLEAHYASLRKAVTEMAAVTNSNTVPEIVRSITSNVNVIKALKNPEYFSELSGTDKQSVTDTLLALLVQLNKVSTENAPDSPDILLDGVSKKDLQLDLKNQLRAQGINLDSRAKEVAPLEDVTLFPDTRT